MSSRETWNRDNGHGRKSRKKNTGRRKLAEKAGRRKPEEAGRRKSEEKSR